MHKLYTFILLFAYSIPHALIADMSPEQVMTKNCLQSYQNNYLSKENHKAFVYAREKETGKDRCSWSYGHTTAQEAIKTAMKSCQSVILNAECQLIDTDGKYKVSNGNFEPLEPLDNSPLSSEEKKRLTQKAQSIILGNCLPFFSNTYLKAQEHKAYSYSVDPNGNYACGYSYNHISRKNAQKSALKACEKDKQKRRAKKPKSPCKIYATNKKIALEAKDFGITIEKKEDIFLSSETYSKKLAQAKEIIDEGACLIQMKYYLRGTMQQAYYYTKEKGKEACGRSENAFTLEVAKNEAKKSCEKMAKKQHIKTPCKLIAQNFEILAKRSKDREKMNEESYKKAIRTGDLKRIKKYIDQGYDVNMQTVKNGITPLFVAAIKKDQTFFFKLIKKGADIKHKTNDNSTILHAAIMGNNIELAEYLLSKGFDINAKGFSGNTPLHIAIYSLNTEMIKRLIKKGAKTDIKNSRGKTASELLQNLNLDQNDFKSKKELQLREPK